MLCAGRAVAAGGQVRPACMSELVERNGWTIAEQVGEPDPGQDAAAAQPRALGRVRGDERDAPVRGRRPGRRRRAPGRAAVGAMDETGQQKTGAATAGVKRQYMGCAGRVANGINTVHLSYVRASTGHALIGARQWIPPSSSPTRCHAGRMGLPGELAFAPRASWRSRSHRRLRRRRWLPTSSAATRCMAAARAAQYLEEPRPGVCAAGRRDFLLTLAGGRQLTCAQAVTTLLRAQAALEIALGGHRLQGRAVVCLGLDRHRQPAALGC